MRRCPRFDKCNANICPLDENKDERTGPFRGEARCTLGKELREKLKGNQDERNLR